MMNRTKSWLMLGTNLFLAACAGDVTFDGDVADGKQAVVECADCGAPECSERPCDLPLEYEVAVRDVLIRRGIVGLPGQPIDGQTTISLRKRPYRDQAVLHFEGFASEALSARLYFHGVTRPGLKVDGVDSSETCYWAVEGSVWACDVTSLVNAWQNSRPHDAFVVRNTSSTANVSFQASEHADVAGRPTLEIDYLGICLSQCDYP
jgi:hypothetical protein